jgi:hypothetical protein
MTDLASLAEKYIKIILLEKTLNVKAAALNNLKTK